MKYLVVTFLLVFVSGCGAAIDKDRVRREFREIHHCQTPEVHHTGLGTWRVSGCGVESHFVCTGHRESLLGLAIAGRGGCVQHNVRHTAAQSAPRAPAPTVESMTHPNGFPVVTASFRADAALLRFIVAPTLEAEYAYLELRLLSSTPDDGACTWRMWVDGDELPLEGLRIEEDDGTRVRRAKFPVSWLSRLSASTRVSGIACGESFALPAHTQRDMNLFEIRFREMRSAGPDAPALVGQ